MPASPESVTNNKFDGARRILVVSLSWLGDCIMAMPAMSALRKRLPHAHITVLAKPAVFPLWTLFPGIDSVLPLEKGFEGMMSTVQLVKMDQFDFVYILPHSFRSAWIPWLARVPGRRGTFGHARCWMLTERVKLSEAARLGHQSLEIAEILHVPSAQLESPPFLHVSVADRERACSRLSGHPRCVAFFPGAAYGPAKRWAPERFAAVGRQLIAERGCRILVLGGKADKPICDVVATGIGEGALNLAGETDLVELVSLLGLCQAVVSNDSGGMHLAAALGVGVVGIFGVTDPVKTAPVGPRSVVLCAEGVNRARDLARDSVEARTAMDSIQVDTVYQAVLRLMAECVRQ